MLTKQERARINWYFLSVSNAAYINGAASMEYLGKALEEYDEIFANEKQKALEYLDSITQDAKTI